MKSKDTDKMDNADAMVDEKPDPATADEAANPVDAVGDPTDPYVPSTDDDPIKAWVRREIRLALLGLGEDTRQLENP